MNGEMYTTFLYAEPSFVEGVARALDLGNTLNTYNAAPSGEQADMLAMEADWLAIREDLDLAFQKTAQAFSARSKEKNE